MSSERSCQEQLHRGTRPGRRTKTEARQSRPQTEEHEEQGPGAPRQACVGTRLEEKCKQRHRSPAPRRQASKSACKKTCTKLSGDNCGRRAKLAKMKQGNHTLRRRSMKAGPGGPAPSQSGHTTRGEKREQWHGSPAPRKQASKSARKKGHAAVSGDSC